MMKRFESDYLEGAHPDVLRALIETNGEQTPGYGEDPHCEAARALLRALDEHCADWTEKTPAVLTHCTSAYHDEAGHHIAMDYGDYFFIEGVRKLAGETRLFWKPLDFAK